jgi:hypothetical protein
LIWWAFFQANHQSQFLLEKQKTQRFFDIYIALKLQMNNIPKAKVASLKLETAPNKLFFLVNSKLQGSNHLVAHPIGTIPTPCQTLCDLYIQIPM